jgi:hypothetical protein
VFVPRFEIDWILRFRRERICFPDIFVRPNIRDILGLLEERRVIRPHGPDPDPAPLVTRRGLQSVEQASRLLGTAVADRLARVELATRFGASAKEQNELLDRPAFAEALPPPLPAEFQKRPAGTAGVKVMRETLAARAKLDPKALAEFDPRRVVGPFIRCFDIFVPEWVPLLDVPDITFRVTQDVNNDGTEEVIYSEGFFDVRWNAGPISNVTLHASPIAVASHTCDAPVVPCGNTPAIQFAGLHPVVNPAAPADPYLDVVAGYARRPNRPHPSGAFSESLPLPLAETPFTRVLQIYGCNRVNNAAFYRLKYSYNGGPVVPFTGLTWPVYRVVGGVLQTHWPVSDSNGWYPVLPQADNWFPDLLLLEWPTGGYADGLYTATLEIGNAAKSVIGTSAAVGFRVDNSAPLTQFTALRWRKAGGAWVNVPPPFTCVVIPRGVVPSDIEIDVSYAVTAQHLRSVQVFGNGCGAGTPTLISPLSTAEHWHANVADNSVANTARFAIAAAASAGAYSFSVLGVSRAFNPSGGDNGHLADWNYDPVYNYSWPSLPVAIVNA